MLGVEIAAADPMCPSEPAVGQRTPPAERQCADDGGHQHPPTEVHVALNLRVARLIPHRGRS
jgi:hypothetical protein